MMRGALPGRLCFLHFDHQIRGAVQIKDAGSGYDRGRGILRHDRRTLQLLSHGHLSALVKRSRNSFSGEPHSALFCGERFAGRLAGLQREPWENSIARASAGSPVRRRDPRIDNRSEIDAADGNHASSDFPNATFSSKPWPRYRRSALRSNRGLPRQPSS